MTGSVSPTPPRPLGLPNAVPQIELRIDGIGRSRAEIERSLRSAPASVPTVAITDADDVPPTPAAAYVAVLTAGAELVDGALTVAVELLGRFPSQLLYADSREGGDVIRRPVFSPLRLREQDYLGPLRVYSAEALGADASQLTAVLHVPRVLSTAASVIVPSGASSDVWPTETRQNGTRRVRYAVEGEPLVSIIIPTRGGSAEINGAARVLVVEAVRAVLERSTYGALEIVVVADDATPQGVINELVAIGGDRLRLVRWSESFNFSAKINRGASVARGDYLLLLNDDVDPISPDWIETMLGLAQQTGVGMVGSLLLFEDDTVQHGGHVYRDSSAGHIAWKWAQDKDDNLGSMTVTREVSGVTAACALISTELFWRIGGLSSVFGGNYNDVDLSLKVRAAGQSIVWTPDARLYHFESKTRIATIAPSELAALRGRWATRLLIDPYWAD